MRANPLVCIEADEVVSPQEWRTVVVFGRYEELPDSPEWRNDRKLVHELLQRRKIWWEPGYAKTILDGSVRPLVPVFFRIADREDHRPPGLRRYRTGNPVADGGSQLGKENFGQGLRWSTVTSDDVRLHNRKASYVT